MKYFNPFSNSNFLFFILLTFNTQAVFSNPNISGQISQQINRNVSQAINKNITDSIIENNKRSHVRIHTKEQIRKTQQLLHDLGFKPGTIDGLMGKKTHKAIKNFQKSLKLKTDGLLTESLFKKLQQSTH